MSETLLAVAISFVLTLLIGKFLIPELRKLKAGQEIRADGPTWHMSKQGTPTMGGLMFILGIGVAIVTAGWEEIQRGNFIYLFVYLFALVFGAIGFVDDFQKLRHHANEGLTALQKFLLQLAAAVAFTVLLRNYGDDVKVRARAMAAAGSDARMSGCELPVIIVSGSGNQGITASVPVIVYAKYLDVDHDTMVRAVTLSDLLTIHLKTGIGRLSAYCGAVSAGCSSGAAIAWLLGGGYEGITHALVNSLATGSGMICDGAKPSCAAKIATAVDVGILGYQMYKDGQQFYGGDGIVTKGVENTIRNIGRLGHDGMRETDKEIIRIMTGL